MGERNLQVIKVWAALVWADGLVAKKEGDALRRLIDTLELTDSERAIAEGYLDAEVTAEGAGLSEIGLPEREGIYRAAVKLAAIDDDFADQEIDFLGRLRKWLALDDRQAEAIEDAVAHER